VTRAGASGPVGMSVRRLILLLLLVLIPGCSAVPQPAATQAPASIRTPEPLAIPSVAAEITLALAGDVMLARGVSQMIQDHGPLYPWGDLLPLVRSADLFLVNLECVIAASGEPFAPPRVFYFRAHPGAVETLVEGGVDYVTLANNHTMDYQGPALLETMRHLDAHGIAHAGAGRNLAEASRFALLEAGGIRVGVVAFADHFQEYAATEDCPGTNVLPISLAAPDFQRVRQALQAARDAGADLVLFSIHWGPNMRPYPTAEFKAFARAVLDAGADIFHGHSAHVFQGVEIYAGKPILYDTGDLIDDYAVDPVLRNDQQLLFLVTAGRQGVKRVAGVPVLISSGQVNLARGATFDQIHERLRERSAAMGTEIHRQGERLVIEQD